MTTPDTTRREAILRVIAKTFLVGDCDNATCDRRVLILGENDQIRLNRAADAILSKEQQAMAEATRQIAGYQHHLRECEQIAGKALGYPWFKDDQKNFPGATEADGVCIGDHVGDTIVAELATGLAEATMRAEKLGVALKEMLEIAETFVPINLDAPGFKRARALLTTGARP